MAIFTRIRARGLQRIPCLKYYNVLKWENRFTLGLNTTKNTDYIKNPSNKSCLELNFPEKTQWMHMSVSAQELSEGAPKIVMYKILL